jgi:hypothetical protein
MPQPHAHVVLCGVWCVSVCVLVWGVCVMCVRLTVCVCVCVCAAGEETRQRHLRVGAGIKAAYTSS